MNDPTDIVVLTTCGHLTDAHLVQGYLADNDIRAEVDGDAVSDFQIAINAGARVLVAKADLERAKALLANHDLDFAGEVDWSQVDVGDVSEE
ncbi:hypothetical protein Pla108_11180 [Botrimarina colliarenosi]|uniref:DUF2007 domain-containing protein n=1 Tax=Botrimarina colliarenosi TaxID=2528001 RepID=A0A5C6AJE2_9BACT|nr:DUF2007 domain-containing protein [Botrimarina colliarenosi]TWU00173.1 hypothetical protein Pla108_11180 [Botrimarina colliarenosi]